MQTVSWAGSTYNIPNQRGDTPWSGLSDFAIAVAAKGINTGGGSFTLLADINFGATFGLVSTYFKSRTSNIASAGILRLANADTIKWRNGANTADLTLSISSDNLNFESTKVLLSGAVINADINASAAIAYSKLAALTASRALVSDGSGIVSVSTVTATELGYVSGVTSAIQTQFTGKASLSGATFTGDTSVTYALSGNNISLKGENTSNTANSHAALQSKVGGTSAGDPYTQYIIPSGSDWSSGIDNSDSDKYKVSQGDGLGTNDAIVISTSGPAVSIHGTSTNDSASTGFVGEYISSTTSGNSNAAATGVWDDLLSISLTAGDWDVSGLVYWASNGSTTQQYRLGISTTAGNVEPSPSGDTEVLFVAAVVPTNIVLPLPAVRILLASTTTVYLKRYSEYTVGTPRTQGGRISARRVR